MPLRDGPAAEAAPESEEKEAVAGPAEKAGVDSGPEQDSGPAETAGVDHGDAGRGGAMRFGTNGNGAASANGLGGNEEEDMDTVVSGRIDGPGGRPLAGATVTVTDHAGTQLARSVTGNDGGFRLTLSAGGSFLLICAAEHHQPAAALINVAAGEIRRVLSLAGSGQVAGSVTDRAGRPLAGATLTLTDPHGTVVATAKAGTDGRYQVDGLDGPEYTLTAVADHAEPVSRTVSPDSPGRIDFVLTVGGVLTGSVRTAGSGRPVPEASVLAVDRNGAVAGAATSGPDGRYELRDLPPGVYTVAASGHAPVAARVEMSGDRTDHDITLGTAPNGFAHAGRPTA
nr:carboxypeptidase-like regulatory domain-containing protein [uncultured Actinoplanes sp.]